MAKETDHQSILPRLHVVVRALSCAVFALVIAACGARGTGGDTAPTLEPVDYTWDLPAIDTAADGADGEMYQALQKSCDDGERMITQKWQQSASPRNVLLFQAGVQACRGDMNQARTLYVRARDEYGLAGLGPAQDTARCDVYKSVVSVLEKSPRDRFPCMDGVSPAFKRAADGTPDNPMTADDESAAVTSTVAPPPPPPTTTTKASSKATHRVTPTKKPAAAPTKAPVKPAPKPVPDKSVGDNSKDDSGSKSDDKSSQDDSGDKSDDKSDKKSKSDDTSKNGDMTGSSGGDPDMSKNGDDNGEPSMTTE